MKAAAVKLRPIESGDIVRCSGYPGKVWRVLAVDASLAHMTSLYSSPRLDAREIPVARLERTHEL